MIMRINICPKCGSGCVSGRQNDASLASAIFSLAFIVQNSKENTFSCGSGPSKRSYSAPVLIRNTD
jgi:hypothetical protein